MLAESLANEYFCVKVAFQDGGSSKGQRASSIFIACFRRPSLPDAHAWQRRYLDNRLLTLKISIQVNPEGGLNPRCRKVNVTFPYTHLTCPGCRTAAPLVESIKLYWYSDWYGQNCLEVVPETHYLTRLCIPFLTNHNCNYLNLLLCHWCSRILKCISVGYLWKAS